MGRRKKSKVMSRKEWLAIDHPLDIGDGAQATLVSGLSRLRLYTKALDPRFASPADPEIIDRQIIRDYADALKWKIGER